MSPLKQIILMALLASGCGSVACTSTQRREAKTVVCHVCEKVTDYCNNGAPLTDAQKQAIVQELYPDGGK